MEKEEREGLKEGRREGPREGGRGNKNGAEKIAIARSARAADAAARPRPCVASSKIWQKEEIGYQNERRARPRPVALAGSLFKKAEGRQEGP